MSVNQKPIKLGGAGALSMPYATTVQNFGLRFSEDRLRVEPPTEELALPEVDMDVEEQALHNERLSGQTLTQAAVSLGWTAPRVERVRARLVRKLKTTRTEGAAVRGGGTSTRPFFMERLSSGRRAWSLSLMPEAFLEIMRAERLQIVETPTAENVSNNISAKRLGASDLRTAGEDHEMDWQSKIGLVVRNFEQPPAVERQPTPQKRVAKKIRNEQVAAAIENAIAQTDGSQVAIETDKLQRLQARHLEARQRLSGLIDTANVPNDVETRIADAIAGNARAEDALSAIKKAHVQLSELATLCEHQERIVKNAERTYQQSVTALLRPMHEAIVASIGRKLRELAVELQREQDLFDELTGGDHGFRPYGLSQMGYPILPLRIGTPDDPNSILSEWTKEAVRNGYKVA